MEGHVVGSLLGIAQGYGYGVSVCDLLHAFSVIYWTVFSVYLLYAAAKDDVIACSVFASGVGKGDGLSLLVYPHALDPWCFRRDGSHLYFLAIGPGAEYLLAVFVFQPCMAVYILGSLWYIAEVCLYVFYIFAYQEIIFVVDTVDILADHVIIALCSGALA